MRKQFHFLSSRLIANPFSWEQTISSQEEPTTLDSEKV
jgi:hypothetical protein